MNVVQFRKPQPLPEDFPAVLRRLADDVEAGQVTGFVGIAIREGAFEMLEPSSLTDSLMLAALLQHTIAEKFRDGA